MWEWIGIKTGFLRVYNIKRDESMEKARRCLEEAFTPQLKSMVSKLMICDKCGRYSE